MYCTNAVVVPVTSYQNANKIFEEDTDVLVGEKHDEQNRRFYFSQNI